MTSTEFSRGYAATHLRHSPPCMTPLPTDCIRLRFRSCGIGRLPRTLSSRPFSNWSERRRDSRAMEGRSLHGCIAASGSTASMRSGVAPATPKHRSPHCLTSGPTIPTRPGRSIPSSKPHSPSSPHSNGRCCSYVMSSDCLVRRLPRCLEPTEAPSSPSPLVPSAGCDAYSAKVRAHEPQ